MKYSIRIANLTIWLLLIAQPVLGQGIDYTTRNYSARYCKSFAHDAYQAASTYSQGAKLQDVLDTIENANVTDSMKHRSFQAIQFVWKNQLDNAVLAYSLALGLCLKPKYFMAPMDDPWITSPRTSKEFF